LSGEGPDTGWLQCDVPLPAARLDGVRGCLLVDDNVSFLDAAATLLERQGLPVLGVATTIAEALLRARELEPDVILIDVTLGAESGFELVRQLAAAHSAAALVLMSTHAEPDLAELIDQTAAAGFVPKAELSASVIRRLTRGHWAT
jgi:DNA-binding NarL/FixJ family response regulator